MLAKKIGFFGGCIAATIEWKSSAAKKDWNE